MTTLLNATVCDFHVLREQCYIRFDDRIRTIGPMSEWVPDGGPVVDARGAFVLPGLVLAHTHVYGTFARGLAVPFAPRDFQELLDQLWWKLDRHLDLPAVRAAGAAAARDYLENGVTTILDHHASGVVRGSLQALAEAVVDTAGMRAAFCFETSDRFDVSACIAENRAFAKTAVPGRSAALFGLHASLSLSDDTLARVAAGRDGLPVHVHAAEAALDETACRERYGQSVIARFDRFGLVGPGSLFAHAVHCDAAERALLKARGAAVVVNPTSNMNNGVGLPDVRAMLDDGIPVLLGDDGMSASAAVELRALRFAMNHRYGSPNVFGIADQRRILADTYAFASRLLGVPLGRIEPGWAADLAVVDYAAPTPVTADNAFAHFLYGMAPAYRPRHVFAAGVHAVADFAAAPRIAAPAAAARTAAEAVWKRIAAEGRSA